MLTRAVSRHTQWSFSHNFYERKKKLDEGAPKISGETVLQTLDTVKQTLLSRNLGPKASLYLCAAGITTV